MDCRRSSADEVPKGISAGALWRDWIHEKLESAVAVVSLLTTHARSNQWVLYEAGMAAILHPQSTIPVLAGLRSADIPRPMTHVQSVDVTARPGVDQLLTAIAALSNTRPSLRSNEYIDAFLQTASAALKDPDWMRELDGAFDRAANLQGPIQSLNREILSRFDKLSRGEYFVWNPRNVYEHDARAIEDLRSGDFYYATYPVGANPEAMDRRSEKGMAFLSYVEAQKKAVRDHRVRVVRLYAVEGGGPIRDETFDRHLREMHDADIEVLLTPRDLFQEDGISDDFVLIGKYCLGTAEPEQGPMIGSRYRCYTEPNRETFKQYMNWFDVAYRNSKRYDPNRKSHWTLPSALDIPNSNKAGRHLTPAFLLPKPGAVHVNGSPARRLMIVLKTNGCAYDAGKRGCTMCDFQLHAAPVPVSAPELMAQLEMGLKTIAADPDVKQIDLLSLGSILHEKEVPREFLYAALERLAAEQSIRKVVIESRHEYVGTRLLRDLRSKLRLDQVLELGLGVETTHDAHRAALNKGLPRQGIFRTMDACAEAGVHFQAYLLIGTPGLAGPEVEEDSVNSAHEIVGWCNDRNLSFRLAFEPVFVTQRTPLERQFLAGSYRLINLWTVLAVLRRTYHLGTIFVGLSDENLSKNRLPEGCAECTVPVRNAIEQFNGTQNILEFEHLRCPRCSPQT